MLAAVIEQMHVFEDQGVRPFRVKTVGTALDPEVKHKNSPVFRPSVGHRNTPGPGPTLRPTFRPAACPVNREITENNVAEHPVLRITSTEPDHAVDTVPLLSGNHRLRTGPLQDQVAGQHDGVVDMMRSLAQPNNTPAAVGDPVNGVLNVLSGLDMNHGTGPHTRKVGKVKLAELLPQPVQIHIIYKGNPAVIDFRVRFIRFGFRCVHRSCDGDRGPEEESDKKSTHEPVPEAVENRN